MILTAHAFNAQLMKDAAQCNVDVRVIVGTFAVALHQSIKFGNAITGSHGQAIDTSRLINSWIMALNKLAFSSDGSAESPINSNPGSVAGMKLGDVIFIATNLIYAQRQEYEHATKSGSLRQTVAHAQALLDEIVRRYRQQAGPSPAAA